MFKILINLSELVRLQFSLQFYYKIDFDFWVVKDDVIDKIIVICLV